MPGRTYQIITQNLPLHDVLYRKLSEKVYEPHWFAGVITTKIACIIGCCAGPPHKENVIFSKNLLDLLSHGFRECKVCKPFSYGASDAIKSYLDKIQILEAPDKSYETGNKELMTWVEKTHFVDLKRYVRVKRVNCLLSSKNPSYSNVIYYRRYWSPIGMMLACFSSKGLCLLEFYDRLMLEVELINLQKKLKGNFKITSKNPIALQLETELNEYFSGMRREFSVPLHKIGSAFQLEVWEMLEKIPLGEVRTYQQQALALNNPSALRAVGNANGKNCISILVPCHRVIGQDGKLTGYGGGLFRKEFLLNLEKSILLNYEVEVCTKNVDKESLVGEEDKKRNKRDLLTLTTSQYSCYSSQPTKKKQKVKQEKVNKINVDDELVDEPKTESNSLRVCEKIVKKCSFFTPTSSKSSNAKGKNETVVNVNRIDLGELT